jgi:transketolase
MTQLDPSARCLELRRTMLETMLRAGRGHLPSAASLVEILAVLYDHVLRHDPRRPAWAGRDRLILSKGHGCLALYAILADKGYFPAAELARFCAPGGLLGGHPEYAKIPGVEASTGSLGHGPSIGVGLALSARMDGDDRRVFVVVGDGECNEGSVWEAALSASRHGLDNFTVIVDANGMQSFGPTAEVSGLEPLAAKWQAFGFATAEVDGHDVAALGEAFGALPLAKGRPSAVICRTVKGKGFDFLENDCHWHHKSKVSEAEAARLRACLEDR